MRRSQNKIHQLRYSAVQGVTMLEFALVTVLLLSFIVAIINIAIFMSYRAALVRCAGMALQDYQKSHVVGYDPRLTDDSAEKATELVNLRSEIATEATDLCSLLINSNNIIQANVSTPYQNAALDATLPIALVRPGEAASFDYGGPVTLPPIDLHPGDPGDEDTSDDTNNTYNQLLQEYPIVAEARANVPIFGGALIGIPRLVAKGNVQGWAVLPASTTAPPPLTVPPTLVATTTTVTTTPTTLPPSTTTTVSTSSTSSTSTTVVSTTTTTPTLPTTTTSTVTSSTSTTVSSSSTTVVTTTTTTSTTTTTICDVPNECRNDVGRNPPSFECTIACNGTWNGTCCVQNVGDGGG